jgi:hypothetical protein
MSHVFWPVSSKTPKVIFVSPLRDHLVETRPSRSGRPHRRIGRPATTWRVVALSSIAASPQTEPARRRDRALFPASAIPETDMSLSPASPDLPVMGGGAVTWPDPGPGVVHAAARAALEYLASLPARRVSPDPDALAAMVGFDIELPDAPRNPVDVVEQLHRLGSAATTASAGGRFFGLVVGATLPAALGARMLTTAWDQVVFNDLTSPVGCALERITTRWITNVLGLPAESHVSYVTGATMGNFTALAAARDALLRRAGHDPLSAGLWNAPRLRVVTGDEVHVTVVKALTLLGFGSAEIERVPTDDQGRICPDALPELDERTIVILQAGNVNSGAIDPFDQVVPHARRAGAWVHVDGAFGLWAAASPALRAGTAGIEDADSWTTDGHKWLNTPYDCGLAIVRDAQALHQVMATQAPYLTAGTAPRPRTWVRSSRGAPARWRYGRRCSHSAVRVWRIWSTGPAPTPGPSPTGCVASATRCSTTSRSTRSSPRRLAIRARPGASPRASRIRASAGSGRRSGGGGPRSGSRC